MTRHMGTFTRMVLIAVVGLLVGDVGANLILTPRYYTTSGENAGTNLFLNTDYIMRLELDSTQHPTVMVRSGNWTVTVPTNTVLFTSGSLPVTNDFFTGLAMISSLNRVDNSIVGNLLDDNVRATANASTGAYNRVGFLGEYAFTTTQLRSNRTFSVFGYAFYDTTGASLPVTINQNRFNVVALPDPQPQVAGTALVASNSTMTLTVNLDRGTSNVVLYCTELGGPETPLTNIVIPLDPPDKVTTNITGLPAPGPKGF